MEATAKTRTEQWIMCRDGVGNIWVGATFQDENAKQIHYHEVYQIVKFSGSHKGLLGLALVGPDDQARIAGGVMNLSVRNVEWACEIRGDAVARIRACPWAP